MQLLASFVKNAMGNVSSVTRTLDPQQLFAFAMSAISEAIKGAALFAVAREWAKRIIARSVLNKKKM